MAQSVVNPRQYPRARGASVLLSRIYLTLLFPILTVIFCIRLIMTPQFAYFEYNRPGFPPDEYGFTTQERMAYASFAINYLTNSEDISYLANLSFLDGSPLFNVRELQHMRDVKAVTQVTYWFAIGAFILAIVNFYNLLFFGERRHVLRRALRQGAILTLAIVAAIVIVVVVNWEFFFVTFHRLLFEDGTWQFEFSDTLIRLFPEQFWFDAALTVGGMTVGIALLTLLLVWFWERRAKI